MILAQSTQFLATPVEKEEDSHCLCENGRKTVAWLVTPKSLGKSRRMLKTAGKNSLCCSPISVSEVRATGSWKILQLCVSSEVMREVKPGGFIVSKAVSSTK